MDFDWKKLVDGAEFESVQTWLYERIKTKSDKFEQIMEDFVYYMINSIKKDIANSSKLQRLLYNVLYFYFAEKGKKFKFEEYTGNFEQSLQLKSNPLIKLVSLYAYGEFEVIYKENDSIVQTNVIDRHLTKYVPIKKPYDELAFKLLKISPKAPLYGDRRIIYLGITTDTNGRDEWYIGQTSMRWEDRHCTIDGLFPSHCIDTGLALFGFTRAKEKDGSSTPLQACDMKYAKNGRHSTRFYLIWSISIEPVPKKLEPDEKKRKALEKAAISTTLETCESYFIEYLEDFTIKQGFVRELTEEDIKLAETYSNSKNHRLSLMKFNSLNGRYEAKTVKSEIKLLNKAFETSFDEEGLVMGINKLNLKDKEEPKKSKTITKPKKSEILSQEEFATKLTKLTGGTMYAAEKHQLYKAWKIVKDLLKKGSVQLKQAVLDYQSLLDDKEKFNSYMNGSLVIELDGKIISLSNKIFE
jgi:hypothetical protein